MVEARSGASNTYSLRERNGWAGISRKLWPRAAAFHASSAHNRHFTVKPSRSDHHRSPDAQSGSRNWPFVTKNFSIISGPKRSSRAANLCIGLRPPSMCG